MTFRVLVTGSRNWTDECAIYEALKALAASVSPQDIIVVHGGQKSSPDPQEGIYAPYGADYLAARAAGMLGMRVEEHKAQWGKYGPAAGPIRNRKMVTLGASMCLAFPEADSRGTLDCMRKAKDADIPVYNLGENIEGFPATTVRALQPTH